MSEQSSQPPDQGLNISDSVLETVQIGGVAGRDLNLTQIQGGVGTINVLGSVQVDQAPLSVAKPLSQQEYRWRRVLLDKVKQFWIEGVLAKSLHMQVLIKLGLEERNEFIQNPLHEIEEFPADSGQVFPEGIAAIDIFEEIGAGRTLLILGEPGAGKTVTLLKLAESLIARTENDLSQSLPVVMNLSSWAKRRQPIANWLVEELHKLYQVSKSLGKTWIEQQQLILLLDGLDEVEAKHRNNCVQALNNFLQEQGLTEMVVCSRISDYEALSARLRLRSSIYVHPLTPRQIDQYLGKAGEQVAALKTLLQKNSELQAFASSPLILSVMSLAYRNCALDELPKINAIEAWRQSLFDAYIERMFQRRGTTKKYAKEKAKRWIIFLARKMADESQALFLIEKIQPSWLKRSIDKLFYLLGICLVGGWSLSLFFWVLFSLSSAFASINPIASPGDFEICLEYPELCPDFPPEKGLLEEFFYIVGNNIADHVTLLKSLWLPFSLLFSLSCKWEIITVELSRWSLKKVKNRIFHSIELATILSLLTIFMITSGISGYLSLALFILIIILVLVCVTGTIDPGSIKTTIPNQGIWKSAKNSVNFIFLSLLIFSLITFLFFSRLSMLRFLLGVLLEGLVYVRIANLIFLVQHIMFGVLFASFFIPIIAFYGGWRACVQHFILRFILYIKGESPWNYARFLDYATDRLFLQKVGGGYIFVHRMLLEHFAQMKL